MITPDSSGRVVIVPCFNEENRIAATNFVTLSNQFRCKIIFVDDGSTDRTVRKILDLPLDSESSTLLKLPKNLGKANAILVGIQLALENDFSYIGLYDADGAIHPNDLGNAFDLMEQFSDISVVSGARVLLAGTEVTRKTHRRWIGRVVATLVSLILEIQIYDPQSPCKVYRAQSLKNLPTLQIGTRWFVDAEILSQLSRTMSSGSKWLLEFPVTNWRDVEGSNLSPRALWVVLHDLWVLKRFKN